MSGSACCTGSPAIFAPMATSDDARPNTPSLSEDALFRSLLESVVDYVGKENVRQVVVHPDFHDGSAQVDICLEDESYGRFEHAVERMGQVRSMFMHELSIEYVLTTDTSCEQVASVDAEELVYA